MIPLFGEEGELPPGVHWATWSEVAERFAWTPRREMLLEGLQRGLQSLREAGCQTAYLDGSFVSDKEEPGDFDVCWEIAGVDSSRLDPVLLTFDNRRAAQRAKYGGEFFPAEATATPEGLRYLDFFQINKQGEPKGIVALDLRRQL